MFQLDRKARFWYVLTFGISALVGVSFAWDAASTSQLVAGSLLAVGGALAGWRMWSRA